MPQCITAETDAQVEPSPCFCSGRKAARHAINSLVKAGATEKRAKGSGTERPQQGADRGHDNENPAAQNRAERRTTGKSAANTPTTATAPLRGAKAPTGIKTCGCMPANAKDPPRQPGESNRSYAFVHAMRATPSITASR